MSVFRFKEFSIKQTDSAMKVGTDSVLLGCLAQIQNPRTIADIGCGTGLLALMMAQRFPSAVIDAIEIDEKAAKEAQFNVQQSLWKNRIQVHHTAIQQFVSHSQYDCMVCNPPYFPWDQNTSIGTINRAHARHTEQLSYSALICAISSMLHEHGICWMILPITEALQFLQLVLQNRLYCTHQIFIVPKEGKLANRMVFALQKKDANYCISEITIYDAQGNYTEAYYHLTKPFLLWLKSPFRKT
jgi:tRNA1Val (adenine37-N6)-methyltransferase